MAGLLVIAAAGLAGCQSLASPSEHEYTLTTHCGIHELEHDGSWYVRDGGALDDGQGNPPEGWDNPSQQGELHIEGDTATFTDDAGHRETFTLREGASGPLQACD